MKFLERNKMGNFELTEEQKNIINTVYDSSKVNKINAFAGSGKTSVLIELVKEIRKKDKDSKILYLVFNKSMVEDSKNKFDSLNLNVECYTTHSFCLRRMLLLKDGDIEVMPNINYSDYMKIKNKNPRYKYCKFKNIIDMFNSYCLCFDNMEDFCKNVKLHPSNYDLMSNHLKTTEIDMFRDLYEYFLKNNKYLHNMYVKEYVCNTADKVRGYKYLLLDEAQDTNMHAMAMLKRINYDKMWIVGDTNQQLYRFNKAINTMDKFEGTTYPLSKSFRFNNEVCEVANKILHLKKNFEGKISNLHNETEVKDNVNKTILFRKNATMFTYAVNLLKDAGENTKVKFMDIKNGNQADSFDLVFSDMIYFYSKLLEGKDVDYYQEFCDNFKIIRCKQVDDYCKIAEKEGYRTLFNFLYSNKEVLNLDYMKFFNFFIINEFDIINILNRVRASENCENPEKLYTLLTVHRSKGLEWDNVKIAPDDWRKDSDDEINILYVAVTRARRKLDYKAIEDLIEVE